MNRNWNVYRVGNPLFTRYTCYTCARSPRDTAELILIFNIIRFKPLYSDIVLITNIWSYSGSIKLNGIEDFLDSLFIYDTDLTLYKSEVEIKNQQDPKSNSVKNSKQSQEKVIFLL